MAENGNGYYSFIKPEKATPIVQPIVPTPAPIQQPTPIPTQSSIMPTTGGPRITPQPTPIQPPTPVWEPEKISPTINTIANTPVQATQPVQSAPQPVPQPIQQPVQQSQGIRDYLVNTLKIDPSLIGFQNGASGQLGKVTINGMPLDIQGLSIQNGQSFAPTDSISNAYNSMNNIPNANINQSNDALINSGIQDFTQAQNTFSDIIKNIQSHPFTDQYIKEKKAYLQQLGKTFDYNPETDLALKQAAKIANRNVEEELNARGILNSSITGDRLAEIQTTLLPQYRQIAFDEYNKQLDLTFRKLDVLQGLTEFDYTQYKDWVSQNIDIAGINLDMASKNLDAMFKVVDQKNNDEIKKIQTQQANMESALIRTKLNGYVSNADSLILGVKPGTLSEEAQMRAYEFEKYAEQQKIQFEYDKKSKALDHQYTLQEISTRAAVETRQQATKAAEKDPFSTATEDQKFWYAEIQKQLYGSEGSSKYVDSALMKLTQNEAGFRQLLGNSLYEYMYNKSQQLTSKMPDYKETTEKPLMDYDTVYSKAYAAKNDIGDQEAFTVIVNAPLPEEQQALLIDQLGLSKLLP